MEAEVRKQMALDLLQACDAGDVEKALALVTDDFHSQFMEAPSEPADGEDAPPPMRLDREAFRAAGIPLIRNVTTDGMNFTLGDVLCEGNKVVVFGQSNGTMKSGQNYKNVYAWKFTFADGKIMELLEYCDTKRARELLAD